MVDGELATSLDIWDAYPSNWYPPWDLKGDGGYNIPVRQPPHHTTRRPNLIINILLKFSFSNVPNDNSISD